MNGQFDRPQPKQESMYMPIGLTVQLPGSENHKLTLENGLSYGAKGAIQEAKLKIGDYADIECIVKMDKDSYII